MEEAFEDFRGMLVSGGTTAGVAGLTGQVKARYPDAIHAIGYVPQMVPDHVEIDLRYDEIRSTEGNDFSPLEPLQYWLDIVASGLKPGQVRLIGMSGGALAAVEYRMALALGARVAIFEDSGRAAARLLADEEWRKSPLLLHLPADGKVVKEFIRTPPSRLDAASREKIARAIHQAYCRAEAESLHSDDPALARWDVLLDDFKTSNRQQADHIFEKLRSISCTVEPAPPGKKAPFEFTSDEVERLAQIEHARWVVERLSEGWRPGEQRDALHKISPYLVSWSALPEIIKERNRKIVRKIPEFLAKVNLRIRRLGTVPDAAS
jgi:hypothetical protein